MVSNLLFFFNHLSAAALPHFASPLHRSCVPFVCFLNPLFVAALRPLASPLHSSCVPFVGFLNLLFAAVLRHVASPLVAAVVSFPAGRGRGAWDQEGAWSRLLARISRRCCGLEHATVTGYSMQQLRVTACNSYGLQHATVTGYTMKHTAYNYRSQQVAALFTLSFGSQHAAALVTIQSTQHLVGMSHRSHRFLAGHSSFPTIIQTSEEFSGGPASILHASFWLS